MLKCCGKSKKMVNTSETETVKNEKPTGVYCHKNFDAINSKDSSIFTVPFYSSERMVSVNFECTSPTDKYKNNAALNSLSKETKGHSEATYFNMESNLTKSHEQNFNLDYPKETRNKLGATDSSKHENKQNLSFEERLRVLREKNYSDTEIDEKNVIQEFEQDNKDTRISDQETISKNSVLRGELKEEVNIQGEEVILRHKDTEEEDIFVEGSSGINLDFSMNFQHFVRMKSRLEEEVQYNRPTSDLMASIYSPKVMAPQFFVDVPESYGIAADGSIVTAFNKVDVEKMN